MQRIRFSYIQPWARLHWAFLVNLQIFIKVSAILSAKGFPFATPTLQKMKFSIKEFFSKCNQIRSFLRIWSLTEEILNGKLFLCSVPAVKWRPFPFVAMHIKNAFPLANTVKVMKYGVILSLDFRYVS